MLCSISVVWCYSTNNCIRHSQVHFTSIASYNCNQRQCMHGCWASVTRHRSYYLCIQAFYVQTKQQQNVMPSFRSSTRTHIITIFTTTFSSPTSTQLLKHLSLNNTTVLQTVKCCYDIQLFALRKGALTSAPPKFEKWSAAFSPHSCSDHIH